MSRTALIGDSNTDIQKGVTVFPDWWHPNATEFWVEMFQKTFNPRTGVDIDGIWYARITD